VKPYKFIISGGGTGGHIFPAVAIAKELKKHYLGSEFLFVGALGRMEMQKVPKLGFKIKGLWITGIKRKLSLQNLLFPLKLFVSCFQSLLILNYFRPNFIIGTGGFASGPLLFVSGLLKIPYLIQEQNSYAGITNKLLGKKAKKIAVAYDNMERFFPKKKIVKTGNPVRQDIFFLEEKKEEARDYFKLNLKKRTLVILGGSLGSKSINALIEKNISFFQLLDFQVIWQCGQIYYSQYKTFHSPKKGIYVCDFITRMDLFYSVADIIISRAGAGTISELSIVGKPSILIPSPNVAEDHQTKNAKVLKDNGAAILLAEKKIKTDFRSIFEDLAKNENRQKEMSKKIKNKALPDATKNIVKIIDVILNEI